MLGLRLFIDEVGLFAGAGKARRRRRIRAYVEEAATDPVAARGSTSATNTCDRALDWMDDGVLCRAHRGGAVRGRDAGLHRPDHAEIAEIPDSVDGDESPIDQPCNAKASRRKGTGSRARVSNSYEIASAHPQGTVQPSRAKWEDEFHRLSRGLLAGKNFHGDAAGPVEEGSGGLSLVRRPRLPAGPRRVPPALPRSFPPAPAAAPGVLRAPTSTGRGWSPGRSRTIRSRSRSTRRP